MRDLDDSLLALSAKFGMRYTRYSDDLTFSCGTGRDRAQVERFKRLILAELSREGFRPNLRKTVIGDRNTTHRVRNACRRSNPEIAAGVQGHAALAAPLPDVTKIWPR